MKILHIICISLLLVVHADAARIKDIAQIEGVRSNQLLGYGLIVGLDGTGDSTSQVKFTTQSFKNMLSNMGVQIDPNDEPKLKNVAAVMVHAELPAFAKPGQKIDITVSSIANAKSLRGGTLLMTQLKGADGQIYALAQGNLIVGGFGTEGADGSKITVNVPSAGRIPNGANVERAAPTTLGTEQTITLNLHTPDFTTSQRLARAINELLGSGSASAQDAAAVQVIAPVDMNQRVSFISMLENVEVQPGEAPARIVVNSRTGTVVIGSHVRVSPAAVTHGSLTVTISEKVNVNQPGGAFNNGETAITPESQIDITQENNKMFLFDPGVGLDEIVRAVNDVGAAPGDLMAILEALKQAGALNAEFIVI